MKTGIGVGSTFLQSAALLLVAALATACSSSDNGGGSGGAAAGGGGSGGSGGGSGGSGGSASFTPATKPSDVCSLLTLSDVQTLLPTATAGVAEPNPPTEDQGYWNVLCKWDDVDLTSSVQLGIGGAITEQGLTLLKSTLTSGTVNTPVSGLGDEAHYFEDNFPGGAEQFSNGVQAIQGSTIVVLGAHFFVAYPTEQQFHPLVAKVLGEL